MDQGASGAARRALAWHLRVGEAWPALPSGLVHWRTAHGWLVHWGGLLRDRAGRLDVSAARIACAAVLSGVQALPKPMPIQDGAS